ncbi:Dynamin-related protein 3A [Bienertia sinuspersici]
MADDSIPSSPSQSMSAESVASLGNSVIPIVNKLQDIAAQLGSNASFDLPQVAVVGSQSSGKSSVLEALVGRDFLPRGCDICTRRPLVLQLLQTKNSNEEWGEFLHLPGKRFYDFNDIRREIQSETDREAGGNKGVIDKQIRLKIFSPNVLDITLVDLPGITKVPVGDQPSDIEGRIRTMIMSYIKIPSCVILAVTPANSDLANSDALQMAGIADPDGYRTIGVITKLDIMDRGTDARNFLLGKVIPLRLGFVGVVNRSQEHSAYSKRANPGAPSAPRHAEDIANNRSIKDALVAEEKFFRSRPVYNDIADQCGVPQLAKKLNQILVRHIKSVLPNLKAQISAQLVSVAKEHASYGETVESKAGQGTVILNILSKYSEAFASLIEGRNEEMSTSELSGGARIHYIFQSIFVKSLEVPFEVLIRKQIARLLDPSIQCARFIYDELIKMSHRCLVGELQRFPILRKRMDEVINSFLREGLHPAEAMIRHIIEMEMDYINTSHPNFLGGAKAVEVASQHIKSSRNSASIAKLKDAGDLDKAPTSEKTIKTRAILPRNANGVIVEQSTRAVGDGEKTAQPGGAANSSWGISSIFGVTDNRSSSKEPSTNKSLSEPVHTLGHSFSMIHLKEPPAILRPTETHSDNESIEIGVTKLLLKSYYDIVRKNVEDSVPKAIMHFLVRTDCLNFP